VARHSVRAAADGKPALGAAAAAAAGILVRRARRTVLRRPCAQPSSGNRPRIDNEDCLYLNVYAPNVISAGEKLPVLFMIHGGLTTGAGDQQDGSLLAQSDGIVVVSVNYRLGPLGFLDLPGLSAAVPDENFGLLDQEAALKWVHANIAGFGGAPSRVAIAGESAGGWSVCALLASPPARGPFARAIMESGSCGSQSQATAQSNSLAFAKAAGCPDAATAAACLRGKDEATLLSASGSYQPLFTYGGPDLPTVPQQAVTSGDYAKVPVLIGTDHDEHAPGLSDSPPGYQRGAGHAMELAYLWPSFTNGYSLSAEFTGAQRELSRQMVAYWGAFTKSGSPDPGGDVRRRDQCSFWNSVAG
jgi:carboxylesterase type B